MQALYERALSAAKSVWSAPLFSTRASGGEGEGNSFEAGLKDPAYQPSAGLKKIAVKASYPPPHSAGRSLRCAAACVQLPCRRSPGSEVLAWHRQHGRPSP